MSTVYCSTVTMPIKLSSYATWCTSETVASVQLPLNSMFFCLVEVLSHIMWCKCSCSMDDAATETGTVSKLHWGNPASLSYLQQILERSKITVDLLRCMKVCPNCFAWNRGDYRHVSLVRGSYLLVCDVRQIHIRKYELKTDIHTSSC